VDRWTAVLWTALPATVANLVGVLAGLSQARGSQRDFVGDRKWQARADLAPGRREDEQRREALELYKMAKAFYEKFVSDHHVRLFLDLSPALMTEARCHPALCFAERGYLRTREIGREVEDAVIQQATLSQLGLLHHLQGRFSDAEQEFEEGLAILQSLPQLAKNNILAMSTTLHQLAILDHRKGNRNRALERLQASCDLDASVQNQEGMKYNQEALRRLRDGESANG
jgi:tetratricopeptide (TPR) repeat protein